MINFSFSTGLHLYQNSPEEMKQAYRAYRGCYEQIQELMSGVRDDLNDLREAIRITNIGLCAGDWERIEVIRQRLNERIVKLRQSHEEFPMYRKIYTDLHHSLSAKNNDNYGYNLKGERVE